MPASTKLKITYQVDENKTSSKTLRNRNPEATNPPRVTKCLRRGTGLFIFFCLPLPVPPLLQTFPLVVHFCQTASATVWTTAGTVRPEVGMLAKQTWGIKLLMSMLMDLCLPSAVPNHSHRKACFGRWAFNRAVPKKAESMAKESKIFYRIALSKHIGQMLKYR